MAVVPGQSSTTGGPLVEREGDVRRGEERRGETNKISRK